MVAAWSAAWLAVRSMITPLPGKAIGLVAYPSHTAGNHVLRPLLPKPDRPGLSPAKTGKGAGRVRCGVVRGCPLGTGQDRCEWQASATVAVCCVVAGSGCVERWLDGGVARLTRQG